MDDASANLYRLEHRYDVYAGGFMLGTEIASFVLDIESKAHAVLTDLAGAVSALALALVIRRILRKTWRGLSNEEIADTVVSVFLFFTIFPDILSTHAKITFSPPLSTISLIFSLVFFIMQFVRESPEYVVCGNGVYKIAELPTLKVLEPKHKAFRVNATVCGCSFAPVAEEV